MQSKLAAMVLAMMVGSAASVLVSSKPDSMRASKNTTMNNVTVAEFQKLHHKLETIAVALEGMLKPDGHGSLAAAKVAPALRTFVSELHATLNATAAPGDLQAAMQRLRSAQASMVGLTKELNAQQESLMREDAVEETNLLLGVLMVRQKEPMEKQLEVLQSPDFSGLPVSKALLTKHDDKTPLFQQVALYMDKHGVAANATGADEHARSLSKTVSFFEDKVQKLEHEEQVMQQSHNERVKAIEDLIKKSDKTTAHRLQLQLKHVNRDFKKGSAMHAQQTKEMKDVVSALKRGDSAALKKARDALQAHLQAMKAKAGEFLYLLQIGHRLAEQDCPFCVAQCIGKCHDNGSPYAQCMTECATAGQ